VRISIFGLGYVGAVSAGCFAQDGHEVVGVDPVPTKVDIINSGRSPIIEADIEELIANAVRTGKLRATCESTEAICATDLSFVCVGTPSQTNGNLDLKYIRRVCEQIALAIKEKKTWHTVVIRSTIVPGTMRKMVIPLLEEFSGKKAGLDFGVCNNPDNFERRIVSFDKLEPSSESTLTTEQMVRHRAIDNGNLRRSVAVEGSEIASAEQWDVHGLEVS